MPVLPASFQWDFKQWREPDAIGLDNKLIWYGPDGERGEYATTAEWEEEENYWIISKYSPFPEPSEEGPILKLTTTVNPDEFFEVFQEIYQGLSYDEIYDYPDEFVRWAVSLGTAKIAYWGGDEEVVEEVSQPKPKRRPKLFR